MPIEAFDHYIGGDDPAAISRVAHETARALLHRVHGSDDPSVVKRTVRYTAEHGVSDLAELWAKSAPRTLPGALWRLYLVHAAVSRDTDGAAIAFRRGVARDRSIHTLVAGAPEPTGPAEIRELTDEILRGAFTGDFANALDRAASFCMVMSLGFGAFADDIDAGDGLTSEPQKLAEAAAVRGARYLEYGRDLAAAAALQRQGKLD